MFICPKTKKKLINNGSNWSTDDNSCVYPVIDGIPVFIPEYSKHESIINSLKSSDKKDWFVNNQVRYSEEFYKPHYNRRKRIVTEEMREYLRKLGSLQNSPVILDMGCGDGLATCWIIPVSGQSRLLITDYNLERLLRARQLLGAEKRFTYFLSDVTMCPLEDESVDLVFCNHVIEHVPNDFSVFANAFRVLKKGGLLILGCPNEGAFCWRLAYALSPSTLKNTDHIHFYKAEGLIKLGKKAGFLHEKTHILGYGFPHWSIDARLRKSKFFDDLFHFIGSRIFRGQGSSLYILFKKA